jgi:hypothetical protein
MNCAVYVSHEELFFKQNPVFHFFDAYLWIAVYLILCILWNVFVCNKNTSICSV